MVRDGRAEDSEPEPFIVGAPLFFKHQNKISKLIT